MAERPDDRKRRTEAAPVNPTGIDAYAPAEIALRVETAGVAKARQSPLQTLVLGVLAGVFIAFGALLFLLVMTGAGHDSGLGFGPARWLGGVAFSLGLILVVVGGAELFTGNNLLVMAWAARRVGGAALLRNWVLVWLANLAGALAMVALTALAGTLSLNDGGLARTAAAAAEAKLALGFLEAFVRGVLCNALVCLAVWLCFSARDVAGKILAIVWPISAFVALGFEHSVANMYLIPLGLLAGGTLGPATLAEALLGNLLPVTLGNLVGGAGGVAAVYWAVYLRHR